MIYPHWRQMLVRSLHVQRSKVESKFFQVANTDTQGLVQNRTMVFRGFADNSHNLLAITDTRSQKYAQWLASPHAQICWYFTKTREQYRFTVELEMFAGLETEQQQNDTYPNIRNNIWNNLSDNAKKQFFWPHPKMQIRDDEQGNDEQSNEVAKELTRCPDNFVVVVFSPTEVDYLNLKTSPQTREIHTVDNNNKWQFTAVHP